MASKNVLGTVAVAGLVVASAYFIFKGIRERQVLEKTISNPTIIKYGSVEVLSKEESVLDPGKALFRRVNSDGSLTTFKVDPSELNIFQRAILKMRF